jgi:hypothetical protein
LYEDFAMVKYDLLMVVFSAIEQKMKDQVSDISELEERIKAVMEEKDKITELFSATSEKLAHEQYLRGKTEFKLERVSSQLTETKQHLLKTTEECQQQRYLVKNYMDSEAELHQQATQLLSTVKVTVSDIQGLQDKVERTQKMEFENESSKQSFKQKFSNSVTVLKEMVLAAADKQAKETSRIQSNISEAVSAWSKNLPHTFVSELREMMRTFMTSINADQPFLEASERIGAQLQDGTSIYKCCVTDLLRGLEEGVVLPMVEILQKQVSRCQEELQAICVTSLQQEKKMQEKQRDLMVIVKNSVSQLESLVMNHVENEVAAFDEQDQWLATMREEQQRQFLDMERQLDSLKETMFQSREKFDASIGKVQRQVNERSQSSIYVRNVFPQNVAQLQAAVCNSEEHVDSGIQQMSSQIVADNKKVGVLCADISDRLRQMTASIGVEVSGVHKCTDEFAAQVVRSVDDQLQTCENITKQQMAMSKEFEAQSEALYLSALDCLSASKSEMKGKVYLWNNELADHQKGIESSTKTVQHSVDVIRHQVGELLDDGIKTVLPTGMTPQRRTFEYPQHLTHSRPHEKMLEGFTLQPQILEIGYESDTDSEMAERETDDTYDTFSSEGKRCIEGSRQSNGTPTLNYHSLEQKENSVKHQGKKRTADSLEETRTKLPLSCIENSVK